MARTGAIAQLPNRIFSARTFVPFVWTWFVVVGMASGAGAGVGRVTITRNDLAIIRVARNTPYRRIMVARVIWGRMAKIVGRCPALCGMACVALRRGVKMTLQARWWLAGRVNTVVAVCTSTGATAVVDPGAAHESCGGMADGAVQAGRNVGGIGLGIHAGGRNTMARRTIIHNTGMIESCRDKATSVMTDTTILTGCNMIDFFRGG